MADENINVQEPVEETAPIEEATPVEETAPVEEAAPQVAPPAEQLRTERSWVKYFFLSIITLGIYGLICFGNISSEINQVASKYDGKKTMNYYLLVFIIAPITCSIGGFVWMLRFCNRLCEEAQRRGLDIEFGAKDYWLWNVLGSLIIVGPFIFLNKFFKTMNAINADYNVKG